MWRFIKAMIRQPDRGAFNVGECNRQWGRLAAIKGGYPSGFRGAGCARVKQDPEGVGSNPTPPI